MSDKPRMTIAPRDWPDERWKNDPPDPDGFLQRRVEISRVKTADGLIIGICIGVVVALPLWALVLVALGWLTD